MSRSQEVLRVAATQEASTPEAIEDLVRQFVGFDSRVVFVFHSSQHAADEVATALKGSLPGAVCVGCSTMGEVGPLGLTTGGISGLALGAGSRAAGRVVDLEGFTFSSAPTLLEDLCTDLDLSTGLLDPSRHLLVLLTDGLSGAEELLIASLGLTAPGLPIVGGSAADDMKMQSTWVHLDGEAAKGSALVMLLEPGVPFELLHIHHYETSEERVVVTGADPLRRRVNSLNGRSAPEFYAEFLGADLSELRRDPGLVASYRTHFAYDLGGKLYLRGVMRVEEDHLLMGGAVEEGAVLKVVRAGDLVARDQQGIGEALEALDTESSGMLLFSCGGRLLEALASNKVEEMYRAMSTVPCAGFSTYGEQFGSMQVNFTLTGVAFGR